MVFGTVIEVGKKYIISSKTNFWLPFLNETSYRPESHIFPSISQLVGFSVCVTTVENAISIHSMKVWWRYVLPNATWFCFPDIWQCCRAARINSLENIFFLKIEEYWFYEKLSKKLGFRKAQLFGHPHLFCLFSSMVT